MSDKQEVDYKKLIRHLDCKPNEFLMLGNSIKPVHIPYHSTWVHKVVEYNIKHKNFSQIKTIAEILPHITV